MAKKKKRAVPKPTGTAATRITGKKHTGKALGRPRMSDDAREVKRLAKNEQQRARRVSIKRHREAAKSKLARGGVLKNGKPPEGFTPTAEQRTYVETLAAVGMRHDEIALVIINPSTAAPINEKTLRRQFEKELREGPIRANGKVADSFYKKAIGNGVGSVTAGIFWLKARMGWRETQHVEIEVNSGVLIPPPGTTPEEWIKKVQAANADKTEPGV